MEKTQIIYGIIYGFALIVSATIPSIVTYRIEKLKLLKENSYQGKPKKKRITKYRIFVFVGVFAFAVISFLVGYWSSTYTKNNNLWIGDWQQSEEWKNGSSEGTLSFWKEGELIKGVSYNRNFEKTFLQGTIDVNGNLSGSWINVSTFLSGDFSIKLDPNEMNFNGYYKIGTVKKDWSGSIFNSLNFTHVVSVKTIAIRNRPLSGSEYDRIGSGDTTLDCETKIDYLQFGDKLIIIEETKQSYKVIAKSRKVLIMGYISKTLSGENTIEKNKSP